jgi:hypothetical protein
MVPYQCLGAAMAPLSKTVISNTDVKPKAKEEGLKKNLQLKI